MVHLCSSSNLNMSNFDNLVKIALNQRNNHDDDNDNNGSITPIDETLSNNENNITKEPMKAELLEAEKIMEQNPRYLAEKEKLATIAQEKEASPFLHPCQNINNTVTLVSSDKAHEIDIEFDKNNSTAMINLIRVDPSNPESFDKLIHTVHSYLTEEKITKVYQYIVLSDWECNLSSIDEFKFVRMVDDKLSMYPFVIIETATNDIIKGISKALGMNVKSHLDRIDNSSDENDDKYEDLDESNN